VQYLTGTPVPAPHQNRIPLLRAGIDALMNDFLYSHYTDNEIVDIFSNYGFSLSISDKIRLKVVQYF
jgi:hypothetical protein